MSTHAVSPILAGVVASLLLTTPALGNDNMPRGAAPEPVSAASTLSPQVKAQVDASVARKVRHQLDLSLGDVTHILTPAQLQAALGIDDGIGTAASTQLERIEVHAPRAQPLQTRIPLGLASIVWAVKHPGEAWRVFTPVVMG